MTRFQNNRGTHNSGGSLLSKIMYKDAGIEYPDQQQIEMDFSALSFQFLQDRAEVILPFLVGFEVVERNQEGSRVIGVFAFKIGKKFYFVPVFFINGQIKGMVSIYDRDTNMFSQLTEINLNKLVGTADKAVGDLTSRLQTFREAENKSLSFLKTPYGKMAEVSKEIHDSWKKMAEHAFSTLEDGDEVREFKNLVFTSKKAEFEPYNPDSSELKHLISWLGPKAADTITGRLLGNEKIASSVASLYGHPLALHVRKDGFNKSAMEFDLETEPEKVLPPVTIITEDTKADGIPDKEHFQSHSFDIKDNRMEEDLSETYDVETTTRLITPEGSGKYPVLLEGGTFKELTVLMSEGSKSFKSDDAIVVDLESGAMIRVDPKDIMADTPKASKHYAIYADARKLTLNGLEKDNVYLFINDKGEYVGRPYLVTSFSKADEYVVYHVERMRLDSIRGKQDYPDYEFETPSTGDYHDKYISGVILRDTEGPARAMDETLIVPIKSYKAIVMPYSKYYQGDDNLKDKTPGPTTPVRSATIPALPLGDRDDFNRRLYKEAYAKLTIHKDNYINDAYLVKSSLAKAGTVNYKQACVLLMAGYGLGAQDVKHIMKTANADGRFDALVMIKSGQYLPEQDVMIPHQMFPEVQGSDPYSGAMLQGPQSAELQGYQPNYLPPQDPGRQGIQDDPMSSQPLAPIDGGPGAQDPGEIDDVFELARIAAESGQKSVFDHAGIAGLAKLYDIGGLIDTYIPEMHKAVDRLGRLAFLFYWRNDGFAERFGTDSLPEVEDTLLSIYRQFGDLVVRLSEREIGNDVGSTF